MESWPSVVCIGAQPLAYIQAPCVSGGTAGLLLLVPGVVLVYHQLRFVSCRGVICVSGVEFLGHGLLLIVAVGLVASFPLPVVP